MLRLKLSHRIQIVRHISNMLVFLGLIGTVIGFIIALSGVNPEAVSQSESVAAMVTTLIQGMSVALYTTLLGAVLNVWLNINYRLLSTGAIDMISEIVAFGETR
ncbi:MAG: MotA/TolQ/ExbB proton channel family protein [Proteobacteria bacterium]|nr:MotA/TolQ/ExbB proton channel family protein [Pseudomonadota bacterium]